MADAARIVGDAVRDVHSAMRSRLRNSASTSIAASFWAARSAGSRPRLFMIYAAGNFIESTRVNPYFQIGESKYGKPIIDRVLTPTTPLDEVAKCALISMDSTLRSNLSVGLPLDLLVYEKDSLRVTRFASIDNDNEYFQMIHRTWGERLRQIFGEIPNPALDRSLRRAAAAARAGIERAASRDRRFAVSRGACADACSDRYGRIAAIGVQRLAAGQTGGARSAAHCRFRPASATHPPKHIKKPAIGGADGWFRVLQSRSRSAPPKRRARSALELVADADDHDFLVAAAARVAKVGDGSLRGRGRRAVRILLRTARVLIQPEPRTGRYASTASSPRPG